MARSMENPVVSGTIEKHNAFDKKVNIALFNDILSFVTRTTAADTVPVTQKLEESHIWYSRSTSDNIQEQYGFRYFGELLEWYEDKFGSDIRDTRAIALAMASADRLLTDDMFVGNQKTTFLSKIKSLMDGDVYLTGAVFLLNRGKPISDKALDKLIRMEYLHTEDLIFAMSLYDGFEQAFRVFKTQLIKLMGISRSISVFSNIGIYAWLIKHMGQTLKNNRAKDIALLRAFSVLPTSYVKQGSREHTTLLEHGYTGEEIIFANAATLFCKPVHDTLYAHSIVAEKIIINLCKTLINSENAHDDFVYAFLDDLFKMYSSFEIKVKGNNGIKEAIKDEITLVNPKSFVWLYKYEKDFDVFHFDILDNKWDDLPKELGFKQYRKLFDEQLLRKATENSSQIKYRIDKYDNLTESSYLESFQNEHINGRDDCFKLLVEKDVLNLRELFTTCSLCGQNDEDKVIPAIIIYIRGYIRGLHSREAFDFFKWFMEQYDFTYMHNLFDERDRYYNSTYFFLDAFYRGDRSYSYYGGNEESFTIKRSFLTDDEHRQIFEWLDSYIFQFKAENYIEFSILMLKDSFITTLYSNDQLRKIYDLVKDTGTKVFSKYSHVLKQRYLTQEELQAEEDCKQAAKEKQKLEEQNRKMQEMRDEFAQLSNSTFKGVLDFLNKHKYSFSNQDDANRIVKENLRKLLESNNYTMKRKEIGRFIHVCGYLIKHNELTVATFKQYLENITEVEIDENI